MKASFGQENFFLNLFCLVELMKRIFNTKKCPVIRENERKLHNNYDLFYLCTDVVCDVFLAINPLIDITLLVFRVRLDSYNTFCSETTCGGRNYILKWVCC